MSRFGPPRISDPDSWEGRMARRQWERYLVEQDDPTLHGTFANEGFRVVDFTDESDSDNSPWRRSDPPPDQPAEPYAGAIYSVNGVDITEFVQAISFNMGNFQEAMNQVAQQISHLSAAQEEAEGVVRVSLHRISDEPYYVDDDLSSRPLTEEDFQRWQDAIDDQPTYQGFDPDSEPQSDDVPDLLDRIAAGVREWDNEKDRGDT